MASREACCQEVKINTHLFAKNRICEQVVYIYQHVANKIKIGYFQSFLKDKCNNPWK
jgi:hypothetical protein